MTLQFVSDTDWVLQLQCCVVQSDTLYTCLYAEIPALVARTCAPAFPFRCLYIVSSLPLCFLFRNIDPQCHFWYTTTPYCLQLESAAPSTPCFRVVMVLSWYCHGVVMVLSCCHGVVVLSWMRLLCISQRITRNR